jgi:threonine dehydratase
MNISSQIIDAFRDCGNLREGTFPASLADFLSDVRHSIFPYLHTTPLIYSSALSNLLGCKVYLKGELFQKTGSFKPRGMLWALMKLDEAQRRKGVITFSSGNAAQGLGYAAKQLDMQATVVMPQHASPAKVAATREYGAEVILHGSVQQCKALCEKLAGEKGLYLVQSYDDYNVMCGHASLGLEIIQALPDVSAIYTPIGGGGLAGGIALAAIASGYSGQLIGVEPSGASGMHQSFEHGMPVSLTEVKTIADGLAAPTAGSKCFSILSHYLNGVLLVDDDEIVEAMIYLMQRTKWMVEPSGAASLAGLLANRSVHRPDDTIVVIVSGGNFDMHRLGDTLSKWADGGEERGGNSLAEPSVQ